MKTLVSRIGNAYGRITVKYIGDNNFSLYVECCIEEEPEEILNKEELLTILNIIPFGIDKYEYDISSWVGDEYDSLCNDEDFPNVIKVYDDTTDEDFSIEVTPKIMIQYLTTEKYLGEE